MSDQTAVERVGNLKWNPSNRTIPPRRTDGYEHTCHNTGCNAAAHYVFEDGDAIWMSCKKCKPEWAVVIAVLVPDKPDIGDGNPHRDDTIERFQVERKNMEQGD